MVAIVHGYFLDTATQPVTLVHPSHNESSLVEDKRYLGHEPDPDILATGTFLGAKAHSDI